MQHYPLKDFLPDVQNQAIGVTEYDQKISDAEFWELTTGGRTPPSGNIERDFVLCGKTVICATPEQVDDPDCILPLMYLYEYVWEKSLSEYLATSIEHLTLYILNAHCLATGNTNDICLSGIFDRMVENYQLKRWEKWNRPEWKMEYEYALTLRGRTRAIGLIKSLLPKPVPEYAVKGTTRDDYALPWETDDSDIFPPPCDPPSESENDDELWATPGDIETQTIAIVNAVESAVNELEDNELLELEVLRKSYPPVPTGKTSKDGWIYVSEFAEMVGKTVGTLGNDRTEKYGGRKTPDELFGIGKNGYVWGQAGKGGKTFYRDPGEKKPS